MNSSIRLEPDLRLDAKGQLDQDLACRRCGYNLRGLSTDGACPECGTAVGQSTFQLHRNWALPCRFA